MTRLPNHYWEKASEECEPALKLFGEDRIKEAFPLFLALAQQGNAVAQHFTAAIVRYSMHRDIPKFDSDEAATEWYAANATQVHEWWAEDIPEAIHWYAKSSEQGDGGSSYNLAEIYSGNSAMKFLGLSWEESKKLAQKYYADAEEQGFGVGFAWREEAYWQEREECVKASLMTP